MMAFESLVTAAKRSAEYSEKHYLLIGWVCAIAMPVTTIVEHIVASPSFNTLGIRVIAGLAGSILIFEKRLPRNVRDKFYILWIGIIAYVLPFSFGAMLVLNAAYTPAFETVSPIWVFQYLIALMFFVNLMHHGPLSTILWIATAFGCALLLLMVDSPNWTEIQNSALLPLPIFVTAVVIGSLANRNVAMVQTEKLRAASAIGANLAHELRTPLASIGAKAKGTSNLLPILTDAYDKAKEAGIEVAPLRKSQLAVLTQALTSIGSEVEYSNTIIDMLLVNTADKSLSIVDMELFSVTSAIQEAVQRYPFNNQRERDLIRVEVKEDFELEAPRLLVIHVLFNLIKNGLYFVQQSGKGDICISAEKDEAGCRILVHDTGMGIPAYVQPHIFERFYTTTHTGQGAGIGLSFCHLVMESIGGTIRCDSEEGEFSTFTLGFPLRS